MEQAKQQPATVDSPWRGAGVVGLTGSIGAGKTTVAQRLAELGAAVIDADKVGHEVLQRPEVAGKLIETFGMSIGNAGGGIDRRKLADVVFGDPSQRKKLEGIVHPLMRDLFEQRGKAALADPLVPMVVLDAAILFESGWHTECNPVVFVDAPREVRAERLLRFRGWSESELTRRESAQWPVEKKRSLATATIDNSGNMSELREAVDRFFAEWKRTSAEKSVAPGGPKSAPATHRPSDVPVLSKDSSNG